MIHLVSIVSLISVLTTIGRTSQNDDYEVFQLIYSDWNWKRDIINSNIDIEQEVVPQLITVLEPLVRITTTPSTAVTTATLEPTDANHEKTDEDSDATIHVERIVPRKTIQEDGVVVYFSVSNLPEDMILKIPEKMVALLASHGLGLNIKDLHFTADPTAEVEAVLSVPVALQTLSGKEMESCTECLLLASPTLTMGNTAQDPASWFNRLHSVAAAVAKDLDVTAVDILLKKVTEGGIEFRVGKTPTDQFAGLAQKWAQVLQNPESAIVQTLPDVDTMHLSTQTSSAVTTALMSTTQRTTRAATSRMTTTTKAVTPTIKSTTMQPRGVDLQAPSGDGKWTGAQVTGLVSGLGLGALLIGAGAYLLAKRRKSQSSESSAPESDLTPGNHTGTYLGGVHVVQDAPTPTPRTWTSTDGRRVID